MCSSLRKVSHIFVSKLVRTSMVERYCRKPYWFGLRSFLLQGPI